MTKTERIFPSGRRQRPAFSASNAVTFQVAVLSNLIARPFFSLVGRRLGLSINEWRLLLVIVDTPGMSQAEIVEATGFNKATVSRLLRNLERYVELAPHPLDSRKHAVLATQAGAALYERFAPDLLWRQDQLTKSLPRAELEQFVKTLSKLIAAAQDWGDRPESDDC